MELLLFLLAGACLIGPVLALVALAKATQLAKEVERLRAELRRARDPEGGRFPSATSAASRTPDAALERPPGAPGDPASSEGSDLAAAPRTPPARPPAAPRSGETHAPPPPETVSSPPLAPLAPSAPRLPAARRASALRAIEWERWLGVRGMAVLGGAVLVLAAILFFRHALQNDWLGPEARVALGLGAGTVLLLLGERLRSRGYGWAPSALQGGGLVALYASIWAADERYGLIPFALAFVGLALVTGLALLLSVRSGSGLVAGLALLGGFATPLLLQGDTPDPLVLFGYLLLLNLGLLAVAGRQRWPLLSLLSLLATTAYQLWWILFHATADQGPLLLAVLALFSALFVLVILRSLGRGDEGGRRQRALRLATLVLALALPLPSAGLLASWPALQQPLWQVQLLCLPLAAAALAVARSQRQPLFALLAASGPLGLTLLDLATRADTTDLSRALAVAWERAGLSLAALAVPAVGLLLARRAGLGTALRQDPATAPAASAGSSMGSSMNIARSEKGDPAGAGLAVLTAGAGWLGFAGLLASTSGDVPPWPIYVALFAPVALLLATERALQLTRLSALVAPVTVALLAIQRMTRWAGDRGGEPLPEFETVLGWSVSLGVVLLFGLLGGRRPHPTPEGREQRELDALRRGRAAACGLAAVLLALDLFDARDLRDLAPLLLSSSALILGLTWLWIAGRLRQSRWLVACAIVPVALHASVLPAVTRTPALLPALVLLVLAPVLPFCWRAGRTAAEDPSEARRDTCARWLALLGPLGAYFVLEAYLAAWLGDTLELEPQRAQDLRRWIGPLLLSVPPLASAALARARGGLDDDGPGEARTAFAWGGMLAAGGLAWGLARWLDREPPVVALGLAALAWTFLAARARRLDLAVLSAVAGTLGGAGLLALSLDRGHWTLGSGLFGNTFSLLHAGFLGLLGIVTWRNARTVRALPRAALHDGAPEHGRRDLLIASGGAAVAVGFVWLNLLIQRHYAPAGSVDDSLLLSFQRLPARDLATSLGWGLYALALLLAGLALKSGGLRWTSLVLLLVTLGKAFLFDLGNLEGLYRVGSLLGLSLSLILVSLLYQRFVFRPDARSEDPSPQPGEDQGP